MQKLTVDLGGQYNLTSASPEFLTLAHFEVQCYIHSAPIQRVGHEWECRCGES